MDPTTIHALDTNEAIGDRGRLRFLRNARRPGVPHAWQPCVARASAALCPNVPPCGCPVIDHVGRYPPESPSDIVLSHDGCEHPRWSQFSRRPLSVIHEAGQMDLLRG
jgi:hypothetical protein